MNTASRMEGSGLAGRIHVSPTTAQELRLQGKGHWLMERPDVVQLRGKGQIQTYWAVPRSNHRSPSAQSAHSGTDYSNSKIEENQEEKVERLIDWNVEVLLQHLQPLVSSRANKPCPSERSLVALRDEEQNLLSRRAGIVVDEMTQILCLPEFDPRTALAATQEIAIPPRVKMQLREFVAMIAVSYRDTPFHVSFPTSSFCPTIIIGNAPR